MAIDLRNIDPDDLPPGAPPIDFCRECGEPFWKTRADKDFCSDKDKRKWHRRRERRALELFDDAMKWRRNREKGGFTRFCQLLDRYLAEDRDREKELKAKRQAAAKKGIAK